MHYTQLGNSQLSISRISFGAMSLKGSEEEQTRLISKAIDHGINFFDTADLYERGMNEAFLGKALMHHREKVIIATKVGNQWREDGSGWDWNPRKDYILQSVEGSLRRLNTDYIDLYQLHGGTMEDPTDETIEAFELLVQQGKIRYYGISSIRPNVIRRWVEKSGMTSVMMQYSLLDRRPEETCLDLLREKGIGVLARGSLAQGLLVNKPSKPYLEHSGGAVEKAAAAVHSLTNDTRGAAQVALGFVLGQPAISSAVVGIRTEEQLNDALAALNMQPLADDELKTLRESVSAFTYKDHR
jgi:aryl-alcohol dehydrogenase-like predicted oxidoreductase